MSCASARERLASLVYGDLSAEEAASVRAHLEACPACRVEHAALERLRHLLDEVPPVRVTRPVDLPRLYRAAAERQARRARRWRRAAVAIFAASAALVALALLPRLELRVRADGLTLRWGTPPPTEEAPPPPTPLPAPASAMVAQRPSSADLEKRLKIVEELIQIVSSDVDRRDQRQRQNLARVLFRLQELQDQTPRLRPTSGERTPFPQQVSFREPDKGVTP